MFLEKFLKMQDDSVENELRKQAEKKGLDYEMVRNDAELGVYLGVAAFGSYFGLIRSKERPLLIDYDDLFWIYKDNDDDKHTNLIFYFTDGEGFLIRSSVQNADRIIDQIKKSDSSVLIGDTVENNRYFNRYTDELPEVKKNFRFINKRDDYLNKLGENAAKSLEVKIRKIFELSAKLQDLDKWWYCNISEPADCNSFRQWCVENGIVFPEALMKFISLANGFCVDYSSTVGYFNIYNFGTDVTTDSWFSRSKEAMFKRDYDSIRNCLPSLGWINHQMLHFNPYTGQMYIERERYKYTLIKDFEKEIIDPLISYLEKQCVLFSRKNQLLDENKNNPFRECYDRLMKIAGDDDLPKENILLPPPATESEIVSWEEEHNICLPEEYRNWVKLSNGGTFANKFILSLDNIGTPDEIVTIDEVEYMILAGLTGCFDYLVFAPSDGNYYFLSEEFEIDESAGFENEIFADAFEWLEEHCDEEDE